MIHIQPAIRLMPARPEMHRAFYRTIEDNRAFLSPWLDWVERITSLQSSYRLLREMAAFNEGGQKLYTFLFENEQLIGSVALVKIDPTNLSGELGFWISKHYQGQGIMKKTCHKFLQYAFNTRALHRIEMMATSSNIRAHQLAQKLGFELEGILKDRILRSNRYEDLHIYGLVRSQWPKQSVEK